MNHDIDSRPIVVEQVYDAPVEVVWKAITDEQQMPRWFFPTIERFEARIGFETRFVVDAEGELYEHVWTVTEVVPHEKITYQWRYEHIPGDSIVEWELSPTSEGTRLTLTHTGHETFPRDNPVFAREAGVQGWTYFLQGSLKAFLDDPGSDLSRSTSP